MDQIFNSPQQSLVICNPRIQSSLDSKIVGSSREDLGAALHAHVMTQTYSQMEQIPALVLVIQNRLPIMTQMAFILIFEVKHYLTQKRLKFFYPIQSIAKYSYEQLM
ncbi:MAG: hypothetical protein HLUCCX10_08765 [Algoriphagus marincola HL-49]|uniref:Uncharacterized protein n=1 Tax=Algoriphagus marincola HL-49 TaxID=1305737 RepID=A0A0P7XHL6_9BACT|nr:MAG: hypothetical protein HLUCCX10_08765 [Algoriphagus marincola HL-49]